MVPDEDEGGRQSVGDGFNQRSASGNQEERRRSEGVSGRPRSRSSSPKRVKRNLERSREQNDATGDQRIGRETSLESFEEDDTEFHVRDLLEWSSRRGKNLEEDEAKHLRLRRRAAYQDFEFDAVGLFYSFALFSLLGVSEFLVKSYLEQTGISLILQMQRYTPHQKDLADTFGFPPDFWGLWPGLFLATRERWRSVGYRIILLQGVGSILQWVLQIFMRQGRPFWIQSKIEMWHCPVTYGFPSGHALLLLVCVAPIIEGLWSPSEEKESVWKSRTRVLGAAFGSSCLVAFYTICVVGRLYLGTHFLHSMLMGMICGVFLLQIFTFRNVDILVDRIKLSIEMESAGPSDFVDIMEILLKSTILGVVLWCLSRLILYVAEHVAASDPDPKSWTERAQKHCGTELDPFESSLGKVDAGIAILCGWIASIALLAARESSEEAQKLYSFPISTNYGSLNNLEATQNEDSSSCSKNSSLRETFFATVQIVLAFVLAFVIQLPLFGKSLAIIIAVALLPRYHKETS